MAEKSRFFKIWLICVISFAVVLAAGLTVFYLWLSEYEATRPINVAKSYSEEVFTKANGEQFLKSGVDTSPYENAKTLGKWLEEKAKAGISVASSSAKKEGADMAFSVSSGEEKIATVYLAEKPEREKLGNKGYKVVSCELEKKFYTDITVRMPQNALLFINGKKVTGVAAQKEKMPDLSGAGIKNESLTQIQTLKIGGFIGAPEILAAVDNKTVEIMNENGVYYVKPNVTAKEKEEIKKVAINCASNYAKFIEKDLPFGEVEKYLKPNTAFYENVKKSLVKYVYVHDADVISEQEASEFYKYSDTVYACRVKLTQTVTVNARKMDFVDKFDKTVYLLKEGATFKVLDMQSVG